MGGSKYFAVLVSKIGKVSMGSVLGCCTCGVSCFMWSNVFEVRGINDSMKFISLVVYG